jgi:hypothetical protein
MAGPYTRVPDGYVGSSNSGATPKATAAPEVNHNSTMEELCDALSELELKQIDILNSYTRAGRMDEAYRELGEQLIKIRYFIKVKVR